MTRFFGFLLMTAGMFLSGSAFANTPTLQWTCTAAGYGKPGSTAIPPQCSGYSCLGDDYLASEAQAHAPIGADVDSYFKAEDTAKSDALRQCWLVTGHCNLHDCVAPNGETIPLRNWSYY